MIWRPAHLADSDVVAVLGTDWRLQVDYIEYAPVGFGSYHWWAVADGRRWFVTADDLDLKRRSGSETLDVPRVRLRAALDTARALCDAGLDFVVAPVPSRTGELIEPVGDRYALAVYPEVVGESGDWGAYQSNEARCAIVELLAKLHGVPPRSAPMALVDDLSIAKRDELVEALGNLETPWETGPFGEPARALLGRHVGALRVVLERYDQLASSVRGRPERMVLSHGEPHPGNTITTADGVMLIDWDTALLAPPERDLWSPADEGPEVLELYAELTGATIDPEAIELYRLSWTLTEISICIAHFRRPHAGGEDARTDWDLLQRYLDPSCLC